ncbi:class III lanthipeptide [Streptomyces uncialis]|nr:class III lanthipeptide [Streptomyces uncialis]
MNEVLGLQEMAADSVEDAELELSSTFSLRCTGIVAE